MNNRWVQILCVTSTLLFSGCSVTHITSHVDLNPLNEIAEKASSKNYSVTWIDDHTLVVSDWWPIASILGLGYTAFHANLHYSEKLLEGDYYLQSNSLFTLFMPMRIDAGPGFFGGANKPYMRSQINEILGFAGASMQSSTLTHGKDKSVIK